MGHPCHSMSSVCAAGYAACFDHTSCSSLVWFQRRLSGSRKKYGPQPFLPNCLRGKMNKAGGYIWKDSGVSTLSPSLISLETVLWSGAWKRLTGFLLPPPLPVRRCCCGRRLSLGELMCSCLIVWKLKTDLEQWEANCFLGAPFSGALLKSLQAFPQLFLK